MPIQQDTRSRIIELITTNPGLHFRKLVELSEHEVGVVEYHTHKLESEGLIFSLSKKGYKLFFQVRWKDNREGLLSLIGYLRKSTPRKIILYLLNDDQSKLISLKDIADTLKIATSTMNWHVKRMLDDRVLNANRRGRIISLSLSFEHDLVHSLGNEIYPTKWEKLLDFINDNSPI